MSLQRRPGEAGRPEGLLDGTADAQHRVVGPPQAHLTRCIPNTGQVRLALIRSTTNTVTTMTAAFAATYSNLCSMSLNQTHMLIATKRIAGPTRLDRITLVSMSRRCWSKERFWSPGGTLGCTTGRSPNQ